MDYRIGYGYDIHKLTKGRRCILGGVHIPFHKGLEGHSDADVLLHAITDALLGALALGDIGTHFPDSDKKWKNADSTLFLKHSLQLLNNKGWTVRNIDSTVIAEKPKLNPHIIEIRKSIANIIEVETGQVSVKATTSEKLGYLGREEGIAAHAVVLIKPVNA